ncbi:tumor protein p63-regulated gene 1 protein isoform X2 [Dunckerocampus dactyliophorus]|uniref:tumor protein p63-regulated gene 1 protein isoform X2 n=1 Tax=Dunckerocampus dactyliophorus TaxID=161453 RepID=UPI002405A24A|nr:tumor protein p63-regulated gene 1 protein isoform X2 [Dunckerocampus dactyliophorus]
MEKTAQVGKVTGDDRPETAEQGPAEGERSSSQFGHSSEEPPLPLDQFKRNKFFVLRPGTLHEAVKEVKSLVDKQVDGNILGVWLLAEVDHWNNEKERLAIITDNFLLLFKYDFIIFKCEQIQKIPLNIVDRICYGTFTFPVKYLLQREGEGLRVFWDRLREPSFTSWWNPFATDLPYVTFTSHPVRHLNDTFASICNIQNFREELKEAAQKAHKVKPVPGKANGVLVLNQCIYIEAYVGLMSFLGNTNKLGYSLARGNLGF